MKSRVRLFKLVVSSTLALLTIGAMLVVLAIFNKALEWDIFGPKLEACLYGVFGSCMAIAGFGVVMTVIIAIQEVSSDFKKLVQSRTNQEETPDALPRAYAYRMLYVVTCMGILVIACSAINHKILSHRCRVFKRLATEQTRNFEPKILNYVEQFPAPPSNNVPRDLYDLIKTMDSLDFVERTTLYIADSREPTVMWGFTAWRECYTNTDGFARFYIAKEFEKAMRQAIDGTNSALQQINNRNEFIWYRPISGVDGKIKAVIRVDGNSHQSFREYMFEN